MAFSIDRAQTDENLAAVLSADLDKVQDEMFLSDAESKLFSLVAERLGREIARLENDANDHRDALRAMKNKGVWLTETN